MHRRPSPPFRVISFLAAACIAAIAAAAEAAAPDPLLTPEVRKAMDAVSAEAIREHVRYFSGDSLEGRDTGSPGGNLAAHYIAERFQGLHLKPAGDDGSFLQKIPFVSYQMSPAHAQFSVSRQDRKQELVFGKDFLLNGAPRCRARLDAPLVFAGWGITAPEFAWDDYRDLDVKGKVVVLLSGEPPSQDPAFFGGEKDTPHANGAAKIALARSHGAVGTVTVLAGERASRYPWHQGAGAQQRPVIALPDAGKSDFPMLMIRGETAAPLFEGAPTGWEEIQRLALGKEMKRFPLEGQAHLDLQPESEPRPASNVAAMLEGSDPALKGQAVVFSAHYDHVGRRAGDGDTIFNGAWDNASGTSEILEIAHAFSQMEPRPRRSILFLLFTGEEKGLLGSRWYTGHPLVPVEETAADINLDMTDIFGIPKEFVPMGAERSSLRESCETVSRETGWGIGADPTPELKVFTRSDQFSFARVGVPCLFMRWAGKYEDVDSETAKQHAQEKLKKDYHQASDQFDPAWSWEGMRRHAQAAFLIGADVARRQEMPSWNADDAFNHPRHVFREEGS